MQQDLEPPGACVAESGAMEMPEQRKRLTVFGKTFPRSERDREIPDSSLPHLSPGLPITQSHPEAKAWEIKLARPASFRGRGAQESGK